MIITAAGDDSKKRSESAFCPPFLPMLSACLNDKGKTGNRVVKRNELKLTKGD